MRHSVRARLLQALVCAGCSLALPGSATATGSSPVHVDPSSPVAKEYALPLATARGAAPESGNSGKLFGPGIQHANPTTTQTTPVGTPTTTAQSEQPLPTTTTTDTVPTTTDTAATTDSADTTAATVAHRPHRKRHRRRHVTVTPPAVTRTTAAARVTARATEAAYRVLRPGSGFGLLWMALAAIVVVALGSAGGLVLRRRR